MELKFRSDQGRRKVDITFNRTAYGIEMSDRLSIPFLSSSFNRTAYGIEITDRVISVSEPFVLLIAPLMELKYIMDEQEMLWIASF